MNKFHPKSGTHKWKNVTVNSLIAGMDGTTYASSPGFALTKYNFDLEMDDGSKKSIPIDEV